MATSILFYPKVTDVGKAQAIAANNLGLSLQLTHVSFGSGSYTPTGAETALVNEKKRVDCTGVMRPQPNQMRLAGVWTDAIDNSEIREIGFWAGDVLFAVWSSTDTDPLGYKSPGVDFVLFCDLAFNDVPEGSITIVINTAVNEAISALVAHEVADDAHIQYLLRRDFVNAHALMTAETVGGTADDITLSLPAETVVSSYTFGQQFVFVAQSANTGAVMVNINGLGAKDVAKNGTILLSEGDIQAGAVYVLFYDGTRFQLSGGVGGSGSTGLSITRRYNFTATAGQTEFECEYGYTPSATFVVLNGQLLNEGYTASDGSLVVLDTGASEGDELAVITFNALALANTYTQEETDDQFAKKSDTVPPGNIEFSARIKAPDGWYKTNGAAKSRTEDQALFEAITVLTSGTLTSGSVTVSGLPSEDLEDIDDLVGPDSPIPISGAGIPSGTTITDVDVTLGTLTLSETATESGSDVALCVAPWGVGDGETTFNLPDLRGDFARFHDDGRGIDAGRKLFSPQESANLSHVHTMVVSTEGNHTHAGSTSSGGAHRHAFVYRAEQFTGRSGAGQGDYFTNELINGNYTETAGNHSHTLNVVSAGNHTHSASAGPSGTTESRPRNRALRGFIKR